MGNPAIIWTFAGVLAAACFARGLRMRDNPRVLAEFLWYTLGAAVLAGGGLLWVSLESEILFQHRIVLGTLGAVFGAFALLALGEWMHTITPTVAQTPPILSPPTPPSSSGSSTNQQGGITGGTIIINQPPIQSNTESIRRNTLINQLRNYYILGHDGISPALAAGLEWPPESWLNQELEKQQQKWRVRIAGSQYQIYEIQK